MKWPVVLIGIVLIGAVLVFALAYGSPNVKSVETATSTVEIIPGVSSVLYSNAEYNFTVMKPVSIETETAGSEAFLRTTAHQVVAFPFPATLFQGTNLIDAGLYIGASSDSKIVNSCRSPVEGEEQVGTKSINGTVFSVFSSQSAAAGNLYERTEYRTAHNGYCFEIVELLHSGNIGNYPEGSIKQFDPDLFRALLDKMLNTFDFMSPAGSGVEGKVTVLCETDRSDHECAAQVRTIEAYQGISSVALFKTAEDGTFQSQLPPGQYELRVDTASSTHCASVGVVVTENSYIATNISCEVGAQG